MNTRIATYAVWAAYLSGIAAILAMVTLILFFGLEAGAGSGQGSHIWGPLSDFFPIVQVLFLLVVARAMYKVERQGALGLSRIGYAIGIVGMVGWGMLQLLLILKVIPFEQEVGPVVVATGIVGVWLILVNHVARVQYILPSRLEWLGIAVGVAFVFEPVMLSALGGGVDWGAIMSNYLFVTGSALVFLVAYVGFPIWAIWLGRVWSANRSESFQRPNAAGARAG